MYLSKLRHTAKAVWKNNQGLETDWEKEEGNKLIGNLFKLS